MVRLTDRPDMTLDVYRGRKTTTQQQQIPSFALFSFFMVFIFRSEARVDNLTRWDKSLNITGTILSFDHLFYLSINPFSFTQ